MAQKQVDAALESHRTERQAQVNRQEETLRSTRAGRTRRATAEDHLGASLEAQQYPAGPRTAAALIPDEQATPSLVPLFQLARVGPAAGPHLPRQDVQLLEFGAQGERGVWAKDFRRGRLPGDDEGARQQRRTAPEQLYPAYGG